MIAIARPSLILSGAYDVVELLVGLEAIVAAPDLAQDTALLKRLRGQSH
jgi:hypothetical protein